MNPKRRALFGLPMLAAVPAGAAIAAVGGAKEIPARGDKVVMGTLNGVPMDVGHFSMLHITNPKELGGQILESARLVEVEIGGKREYVMTFERIA